MVERLLKEKEAGRRENLLEDLFSSFDRSVSFLKSLSFREKLKDGRRESVDFRGVSLEMGVFILVGGCLFSLCGVSFGECGCERGPDIEAVLKKLPRVFERLCPRGGSLRPKVGGGAYCCVLGSPIESAWLKASDWGMGPEMLYRPSDFGCVTLP